MTVQNTKMDKAYHLWGTTNGLAFSKDNVTMSDASNVFANASIFWTTTAN